MQSPSGTIVSFVASGEGQRAIVDVDSDIVCERCAAGKGCGAALFGASRGGRRVEAAVAAGNDFRIGDRVEIDMRPRDLLHAAVGVYGPPLAGALLASLVAYGAVFDDVDAAAAALLGCMLGAFISRWHLNRPTCMSQFVPRVTRHLPTQRLPG